MSSNESKIQSRLNILINRLAKMVLKSSMHKFLYHDVIELIVSFYGYACAFLITTKFVQTSSQTIGLFNITTQTNQQALLLDLSNKKSEFEYNFGSLTCVASNCALPERIKTAHQSESTYSNESFLYRNECNLLFYLGTEGHKLLITHPSLYENALHKMYSFDFVGTYYNQNPCTYNKTNQILYQLRTDAFYALDFKDTMRYWQWERIKYPGFSSDYGVTICMIDNDRFISCVSENGKKAYLYALNCDSTIPLCDTNLKRSASTSCYHNKYHKIIVCGYNNIEWYDINKDKWIVIAKNCFPGVCVLNNVLHCPFDANVICGAGCYTSYGSKTWMKNSMGFAFEVDVRDNKMNIVKCKIPSNYDYNVSYVRL